MKAYSPMLVLLGMLSAFLVVGCADQFIPSTETPLPTNTATLTATPTDTPIPTIAPTNTQTPTPTLVPTPIPTLPVEQAEAKLLQLLANNADCQLPCVWGITPGKTTNLEARAVLLPLSNISANLDNLEHMSFDYVENDSTLSVALSYSYTNDDDVIRHIGLSAGQLKYTSDRVVSIYDSKVFGDRLRPYMLSGVLSALGKPDSVAVQAAVGYEFEIVLLYPEQGIAARYTTDIEVIGENARGCPANAHVELELYPSGDADFFVESLSSILTWQAFVRRELINNEYWKSLEVATSMSLDEFYETFRKPTDKCIETPLQGWYVPDDVPEH